MLAKFFGFVKVKDSKWKSYWEKLDEIKEMKGLVEQGLRVKSY